jgi:DNA-binding NarL/FixJ family response regulator
MTNQSRIRILCVDDHALAREGISFAVRMQPDMELIAQADNGCAALQSYKAHCPDVTLMDLRLPDMSGIEALVSIRAKYREAKVIILTGFDGDVAIQRALAAGARGYLPKSTPPHAIIEAIRDVHSGKMGIAPEIAGRVAEHLADEFLSEREVEVLRQVAGGVQNREIGIRLFIAEATVKAHMKHIMEKLRAGDRTHAVTIAVRRGIIRL